MGPLKGTLSYGYTIIQYKNYMEIKVDFYDEHETFIIVLSTGVAVQPSLHSSPLVGGNAPLQ